MTPGQIAEQAGKAPETASEKPADTIALATRKPFVVQFKANSNLSPRSFNVSVMATDEKEATGLCADKVIGQTIDGEHIEAINVFGCFPAQIPPLLA